mmetsp:Transcript_11863/g.17942  ORF Transcript_11863/g.17942 Transcript_11863/m.17942 type:complete len:178 (+) Transcript_11863:214-747(+)
MERIIATSKQTVGDNDGHGHIDEIRDSNNQSSHHAKATTTTREVSSSDEADSEDEIGAMIYQRSGSTAKARGAVSGTAKAKRTIPNEESEYTSPPKKTRKQSRSRRLCSHEGCTNYAQKGGVCFSHGAKRKECSYEGCNSGAIRGGVCFRHGAKRKECRERGDHAVKVVNERVANVV